MGEISERNEPFQLKGGSLTTVVLKLVDPTDEEFFPQLFRRIRQAPSFFKNAPVIIDLEDLSPGLAQPIDLRQLQDWLRQHEMIPIGVQGGTPEGQRAAIEAGLPVVPFARSSKADLSGKERAVEEPKAAPEPAKELPLKGEPPPARPTVLVKDPVRSGRRIYAKHGDLIVLAPVSAGAELLADGHIHIYSTLRGRALAGLSGDRNARIFCQCLQAELVSIAGLYRLSEDIEKTVYKKSVQIFLEADRLRMDVMTA
jgi:septum site-determining protein MinC